MKKNITPQQLRYPCSLNTLLKQKELEIISKGKEYLLLIQRKLIDEESVTTDYEFEADVQFYLKESAGNPVYVSKWSFGLDNLKSNEWNLFNDGEDWWESYMPILNQPYCYLMHDLVDHSHVHEQIFNIKIIWIDYKIYDQSMMEYKNKKWLFVNHQQFIHS